MTTLPCYPVLKEFHKESLIYNKKSVDIKKC